MTSKLLIAFAAATAIIATPLAASAQGSTDQNGNVAFGARWCADAPSCCARAAFHAAVRPLRPIAGSTHRLAQ